ncbi:hypothetical protein GQ55_9G060400 [Panicum hallii var. hallii]|uniref:Uncharacterized protein n=1 Tax=Panicum hallii var. hallii TaxID=1504633 RepID=A0A2T7C057_9POAL|nr:hypothetical protein GQ55_9G060400 [Panicum hallii var. hallii]
MKSIHSPSFKKKNLQSLHYTFHRRLLRPVAPSTPLPNLRPACAGAAAPDCHLPDDARARPTGIPPRRAARAPPLGTATAAAAGRVPDAVHLLLLLWRRRRRRRRRGELRHSGERLPAHVVGVGDEGAVQHRGGGSVASSDPPALSRPIRQAVAQVRKCMLRGNLRIWGIISTLDMVRLRTSSTKVKQNGWYRTQHTRCSAMLKLSGWISRMAAASTVVMPL